MNVSLTPELDSWVNEKVSCGLYRSSSEVIREGLRTLIRQEEQKKAMVESLRSELRIGIRQLDTGKSREFDQNLINEIVETGRSRL